MNAKTTSLFAGIALLASVGMANAEERLTAASMDAVTAAGGHKGGHHGHHHHRGTSATAEAVALCEDSSRCSADTFALAKVDDNSATSVSAASASQH